MRRVRIGDWVVAVFALVPVVIAACSSDSTSADPNSADAGAANDAASAADSTAPPSDAAAESSADAQSDAPVSSCSGFTGKGGVTGFFAPQGAPALPITVEWNGCPPPVQAVAGTPFPTWTMPVGGGEGYFRTTTAGFHTTLSQYLLGSVFGAALPGTLVYAVKTIPGYDAAKGHLIVSLNAVQNTCVAGDKDGSTVTVPGHPEAVVTYIDKQGNALVGATMSSEGLAVVTNLDPAVSADVKPIINVAGGPCTVFPVYFADHAPVEADTVAVYQAEAR